MHEELGAEIRRIIVDDSIERIEWHFLQYVATRGKPGIVFVLNLLDENCRRNAEEVAGREEVREAVEHFKANGVSPVFWLVMSVENGLKTIGQVEPTLHRELSELEAVGWPEDKFLAIGMSHDGMLPRWLTKP